MGPMQGWRTFVYGALIIAISALSGDEARVWIAEHLPWAGGIIGAGVIFLRAITSSPIFKRE